VIYLVFEGRFYYPEGGADDFTGTIEAASDMEAVRSWEPQTAMRRNCWGHLARMEGDRLIKVFEVQEGKPVGDPS
jgi:hypothetical protein